ncbi:MAG TPA: hypothetical protein VFS41_07400 [Edaphobacter sp.]|nr:hypothetical protein [Edaphobacter sp.]
MELLEDLLFEALCEFAEFAAWLLAEFSEFELFDALFAELLEAEFAAFVSPAEEFWLAAAV